MLVGLSIIGLTAFLAVIVQGIGQGLFGRNQQDEYLSKSRSFQTHWRGIGGKNQNKSASARLATKGLD